MRKGTKGLFLMAVLLLLEGCGRTYVEADVTILSTEAETSIVEFTTSDRKSVV